MVVMRHGEIPVPIPNTTVKPTTADGTMLETAWENRWLPTFIFLAVTFVSAMYVSPSGCHNREAR